MRTLAIAGLFLLFTGTAAFSQTKTGDSTSFIRGAAPEVPAPTPSAFPTESDADEPAQLSGGRTDWILYVSNNMRYPETARQDKVSGKVTIELIVDTHGKPQEAKVFKGVREDLDQEALRLVREMPNWIPAKKDGRFINQKAMISVNFPAMASVPDPRR